MNGTDGVFLGTCEEDPGQILWLTYIRIINSLQRFVRHHLSSESPLIGSLRNGQKLVYSVVSLCIRGTFFVSFVRYGNLCIVTNHGDNNFNKGKHILHKLQSYKCHLNSPSILSIPLLGVKRLLFCLVTDTFYLDGSRRR